MDNLIERYVYDVVRRLPEQEQDEVGNELRSNIYDMLPEHATDEEVCSVITELGSPALLAEQYRQNSRCLISAARYDDYIRVLKWVLPLVGCILMIIGLLHGGAEATTEGITDYPQLIAGAISSGISSGLSGAVQALVWVTVGFAIADRASKRTSAADRWSIKDLPKELPSSKKTIPLSDSIVELIMIAFFSTLAVLLCSGQLPIAFMLSSEGVQVSQFFSNSFLAACIPAVVIGGVLGICESMAKIIQRRWTPWVCGATIANNLTSIGLFLYLCSRPDIFSLSFLTLAQSEGWKWFTGTPVLKNPLVMLVAAIVIVASLAECGTAIYRTTRAKKTA